MPADSSSSGSLGGENAGEVSRFQSYKEFSNFRLDGFDDGDETIAENTMTFGQQRSWERTVGAQVRIASLTLPRVWAEKRELVNKVDSPRFQESDGSLPGGFFAGEPHHACKVPPLDT